MTQPSFAFEQCYANRVVSFFPRGNGPLLSFILPTRGRPQKMIDSILSVARNAVSESSFEFLIRCDDDDPETHDAIAILCQNCPELNIKAFSGPRGKGYADMHHYCNDLASKATGDWLILWDDDFIMKTEKFDFIIHNAFCGPGTAFPWCQDILVFSSVNNNVFTCLRRKAYELLGRLSESFVVDAYLYKVMNMVEAIARIDIVVEHTHTTDIIINQYEAYQSCHHLGPEIKRACMEDVEKLIDYQEKKEKEANWIDNPDRTGWYIWKVPMQYPTSIYIDGNEDSKWIMDRERCSYYLRSYCIDGLGNVNTIDDGKAVEQDRGWLLMRECK